MRLLLALLFTAAASCAQGGLHETLEQPKGRELRAVANGVVLKMSRTRPAGGPWGCVSGARTGAGTLELRYEGLDAEGRVTLRERSTLAGGPPELREIKVEPEGEPEIVVANTRLRITGATPAQLKYKLFDAPQ